MGFMLCNLVIIWSVTYWTLVCLVILGFGSVQQSLITKESSAALMPPLSIESLYFCSVIFFFHVFGCEWRNYDFFSGNTDITSCYKLRRPGFTFYPRFMRLKPCNCPLGIILNLSPWCVQVIWHAAAYIGVLENISKSLSESYQLDSIEFYQLLSADLSFQRPAFS